MDIYAGCHSGGAEPTTTLQTKDTMDHEDDCPLCAGRATLKSEFLDQLLAAAERYETGICLNAGDYTDEELEALLALPDDQKWWTSIDTTGMSDAMFMRLITPHFEGDD